MSNMFDLSLRRDEARGDERGTPKSDPIEIPYAGRGRARTHPVGRSDAGEGLSRQGCSGLPYQTHMFPPSFTESYRKLPEKRSISTDPSVLEHRLRETMVRFEDVHYLPMSVAALHYLSPSWEGLKSVSNVKMFERLLINKDINQVHAEHVMATLGRIGKHCKHLLVVSPIHTTELGEVFNRELGNMTSPSSDWTKIFQSFPNLESVHFRHPDHEPKALMIITYNGFRRALVAAGYPETFQVHISGPLELTQGL